MGTDSRKYAESFNLLKISMPEWFNTAYRYRIASGPGTLAKIISTLKLSSHPSLPRYDMCVLKKSFLGTSRTSERPARGRDEVIVNKINTDSPSDFRADLTV